MLYVGYLIIVNGQNIKNIGFQIFLFELPRVENCISRLGSSPLPLFKHANRVKTGN